MPKKIILPFEKAKNILQEGDILLFRGSGLISNLIKIAGVGEYSHVAIASKHDNYWEAVEYREFYGGRTVNLENYLKICKKNKTQIDVYRVCPKLSWLEFNPFLENVEYKTSDFDGKVITDCMRKLTALPYSYRRIWLIAKIKLFRWKILKDLDKITREIPTDDIVYPVCSTVASHCFSKQGWPFLKRKSDEYMEPSDISRSPRCNYLLTLDI